MTEGHNYGERPERPGRRRKYHRGPCGSFTSTRRRQHALIGRSAPSPARARGSPAREYFYRRGGKEREGKKGGKTIEPPAIHLPTARFSSLHFSFPPFFFSLLSFCTEISPARGWGSHRRDGYLSRVNVGRETRLKIKTSSSPAFTAIWKSEEGRFSEEESEGERRFGWRDRESSIFLSRIETRYSNLNCLDLTTYLKP